jgi:Cof subfamily protein (haloacid dehalogenase superfamily)
MTPIRLLAIDLDGTLLNRQRKLSDANRAALRQAHDLGVHIAFVTGRRYRHARPLTGAFAFPHSVIATNGATTWSSAGELLRAHVIEPELVRETLWHMAAFRSQTFLLSETSGREGLAGQAPNLGNRHIARFVEHNFDSLVVTPDLARAVGGAVVDIMLIGHVGEMRDAMAAIETFPKRREVSVLPTMYEEVDLCLLDVVAGTTDKGCAVRELAGTLGIEREAVMAIGDNLNDREMLLYAGCAVAMGNACAEVKALGCHLTSTNDEDGVARAIDTFILRAAAP